jgi:hypothetical protein
MTQNTEPDLLTLIARQHREALVLLSKHAKCKLQGLAAGGTLLALSNNTKRKLRFLDWSYGLCRKITAESIEAFLSDLESEIEKLNNRPLCSTTFEYSDESVGELDAKSLNSVHSSVLSEQVPLDSLDRWLFDAPTACDKIVQTECTQADTVEVKLVQPTKEASSQTFPTFYGPPPLCEPPRPLQGCRDAAETSGYGSDDHGDDAANEALEMQFKRLYDLDKTMTANPEKIRDEKAKSDAHFDRSGLQADPRFSQIIDGILKVPLSHRRRFIMSTFAKLISCNPQQVQQLAQWRDSMLENSDV